MKRMSRTDLFDKLNVLAGRLDEIPYINYGGCGYVATIVADYLQHILPNVGVITMGWDPNVNAVHRVRRRIPFTKRYDARTWFSNGVENCHLLVRFTYGGKNYFFDSNGVGCADFVKDNWHEFDIVPGTLTVAESLTLTEYRGCWNSRFDISYADEIKDIVREFFRDEFHLVIAPTTILNKHEILLSQVVNHEVKFRTVIQRKQAKTRKQRKAA